MLPLNYPELKYTTRDYERFLGAAATQLSEITQRVLSVFTHRRMPNSLQVGLFRSRL